MSHLLLQSYLEYNSFYKYLISYNQTLNLLTKCLLPKLRVNRTLKVKTMERKLLPVSVALMSVGTNATI